MDIPCVPTVELASKAAPYNPRRISDHDLEALRRSLRTFGTVEPIVVNRRFDRIVGGHQRVRAAELEGIDSLPVVYVDLDEAQERQLNLALNRIHGEWDEAKLGQLLSELEGMGADLALTGFTDMELHELLKEEPLELPEESDPDAVPEPPPEPKSRPGDLIELGKHRLLCGSALQRQDVLRLLDGPEVDLLLTDPPYNVAYQGGQGLTIQNDDLSDVQYDAFLLAAFRNAHDVMKPGASFYIWHADSKGLQVRRAAEDAGLRVRQCLVWVKSSFVMGRQDFHWQHEPCLYGWKDGAAHHWYADRSESTVIHCEKPVRNENHPTIKPTELFARLMRNSSGPGGVVFDPFAGSGTTVIAAELLGKRAFLLELDPAYCDLIVQRWQKFTGRRSEIWRGNP